MSLGDVKIKIRTDLSTGMFPEAQRVAARRHLKQLLANLPKGSKAVIAGGAPRDWHHGWGCRDVDIFYQTNEMSNKYIQQKANVTRNSYYNGYGYGENDIMTIHEYPIYSGCLKYRKVQLIRTIKDPMLTIRNFPINLSRIWMDNTGKIMCDHHYEWGYNHRMIHQVNHSQWVYPYLRKIMGRYHQYGFMPINWHTREQTDKLK